MYGKYVNESLLSISGKQISFSSVSTSFLDTFEPQPDRLCFAGIFFLSEAGFTGDARVWVTTRASQRDFLEAEQNNKTCH